MEHHINPPGGVAIMPQATTLPDYLRPGLAIVSIGLNPSLPSVRAGFYFANPRNRFWRALNGSELVPVELSPGTAAMEYLFNECGIGFTDVVKRATAGGAQLRAADYREWAPVLRDKLQAAGPVIAWFHGKQAFRHYLRYAEGLRPANIEWGEQPYFIGDSHIFVTPNPSPANAVYTLAALVEWYRQLEVLRVRLAASG